MLLLDTFKINVKNVKDFKNNTALHKLLLKKKDIDNTKLQQLLNHGCPVNAKNCEGETPLHLACRIGNYSSAELLLYYNADLMVQDNKGFTALHYAVFGEYFNVTKLLLKYKSPVNKKEKNGNTPLHLSFKLDDSRYQGIPALLLLSDANVMIENNEKDTPLHKAAGSYDCNYNLLLKLLKLGADVHAINAKGETPLLIAVREEIYPHIEFLLKYNSNVNFRNTQTGNTSLHIVNQYGIMRILLYYGADISIKNVKGETAVDMFSRKKREKLMDLIKENEDMKGIKLNSNTCLHDILFMNSNNMARYVNNVILKEMYESENGFSQRFPNHGYLLKSKFHLGLVKNNLIKKSKDSLEYISNFVLLEDCIYERIFSYLSNTDLGNISACEKLMEKTFNLL